MKKIMQLKSCEIAMIAGGIATATMKKNDTMGNAICAATWDLARYVVVVAGIGWFGTMLVKYVGKNRQARVVTLPISNRSNPYRNIVRLEVSEVPMLMKDFEMHMYRTTYEHQ